MRRLLILATLWLASATLTAQDVEIYSRGDTITAGRFASFSVRIDGHEAGFLAGIGYQWRSNPQTQFFGTDTHLASFRIPDNALQFEVILTLRGRYTGVHRKVFSVVRPEPEPEPDPEPEEPEEPEESEPPEEPEPDVPMDDIDKAIQMLQQVIEFLRGMKNG